MVCLSAISYVLLPRQSAMFTSHVSTNRIFVGLRFSVLALAAALASACEQPSTAPADEDVEVTD
jgi:hypothetical protein